MRHTLGSMFEAVEATHALDSAAGTTTTGLDLYRRLTPEQAAARSAEDAARVAAQVEAEEVLAGGTGDIARVILGQSRTDRQQLAKGLRNTINSLYSGATVLEVFHEATHGWRREARARGLLTREDDVAILRAADAVLAGKTTRREKTQLRFLPENFGSLTAERQETLLDEGISKLIEAEVLRMRKTGGALDLPPGLVSRNLAAFARIAGKESTRRFSSFIKAIRQFFGLALARAHHIDQGLKDGRINPEDYEAYLNKLLGTREDAAVSTSPKSFDGISDEAALSIGDDGRRPAPDNRPLIEIGKPLNSQKSKIPKAPGKIHMVLRPSTRHQWRTIVTDWLERVQSVKDPDGDSVLLANPERGGLPNRASHLIGSFRKEDTYHRGEREIRDDKARTVMLIPMTIQDYQVKAEDGKGTLAYIRRYEDGTIHMVLVEKASGKHQSHRLITQRALDPKGGAEGLAVQKVRASSALSPSSPSPGQAGADREATPGRLPANQQGFTPPERTHEEDRPADTGSQTDSESGPDAGSQFSISSEDRGSFSPSPKENPFRGPDGKLIIPRHPDAAEAPDLAAKEEEFLAILNQEIAVVDALYDALAETHGGKVISTDLPRELLPAFTASPEGAARYTAITSAGARVYGRDRLWREIHDRGGRTSLLFTSGGIAAGKSSVVSDEMVRAFDLVYDATLRETEWAVRNIEKALAAGWEVRIAYVQRPIALALRGAIERAARIGRSFPLADLPTAHRDAQRSIVHIAKHFANHSGVEIRFYLNAGADVTIPAKRIDLSQIDKGGEYSYEHHQDATDPGRTKSFVGSNESSSPERFRASSRPGVLDAFREAVGRTDLSTRLLAGFAGSDPELQAILREERGEGDPESTLSNLENATDAISEPFSDTFLHNSRVTEPNPPAHPSEPGSKSPPESEKSPSPRGTHETPGTKSSSPSKEPRPRGGSVSSFKSYLGIDEEGIRATIDEFGMVDFTFKTGPNTPNGTRMFNEMLAHFGPMAKGIRGNWIDADELSTNFNSYKANLAKGLTPEDAAALTPTGKMAIRSGFTEIIVYKDTETYILVEFSR